jgi:hypothetical protein
MTNRHDRRVQARRDRKAIKGIAKATGHTEPSASEKDPAYLSLQLKSLIADFENFNEAYNQNLEAFRKGFSMMDVHQQVLLRLTRDLTGGLIKVRKLQVDGDVSLSIHDFGELKLHPEGELNLGAYYEEYRKVAEAAGPEHADLAVVIWSKGASPEAAVERATLEHTRQVAQEARDDGDYETEYFSGGSNGQDRQQQEPTAAGADG